MARYLSRMSGGMKVNKYICPECGGTLIYWEEEVVEKKKSIDSRTGKVYGKATKTITEGENEGVACESCGWMYNTVNLVGSKNVPKWIEELGERKRSW